MKTKSTLYLLILCTLFLTSCSTDDNEFTTDEITNPISSDNPDNTDDDDSDGDDNDDTDGNASAEPCGFDLASVPPNSTITINCTLDLDGKVISLPANTEFEFEKGGTLINGSLTFSGGIIDGRLMNSTLEINGNVSLKDPVFKFETSKWDIVEGKITDEIAKNNKDILQNLIDIVKKMQGNTFSINDLDAYFKVDKPLSEAVPQDAAITLPSNFKFEMSNQTHLRMQPNSYKQPTLLSVTNGNSNVIIEGGFLHGERDEHDYSDGGTHEWVHLLRLKACSFVTVKNVTFMDAAGDGIDISGLGHSFAANYNPSHDLLIIGNTFIRNRRNNMSITDGYDIIVEGNEFIDAGIHTSSSKGIAPSFAIDVEAFRGSGPKPYQVAEDIIIRNNTERGSRIGGFTVHTGDRVTIENNTMENCISYSTTIGTIIRNNTITSTSDFNTKNGTAITAGRNDRFEKNHGNKVYGNTINGFSTGIKVSNTELEVYENNINNCKVGLSLEVITNSIITKNNIKSTRNSSDGILSAGQSKYIDKVTISENIIDVKRTPFQLVGINNDAGEENYSLTISNNTFSNGGATLSDTHGFLFSDNNSNNGGVRLVNAQRGEILNNSIELDNAHGIRIDQGCQNIKIKNNNIDINTKFNCIQQNSNDGINIIIDNNTCM